jgi:hypothetical protein
MEKAKGLEEAGRGEEGEGRRRGQGNSGRRSGEEECVAKEGWGR